MVGQVIAHYRILQKLGEGGMGVVYKAQDTHLDRFVAIKLLPPERVENAERKRRFVQEAKAASALNHPNIVTVHDIDTADGVTFIAMEHVPGRTLDELLSRKALRVNEALAYGIQITDALSAAHAAGIVHRDLKPSNLMIGDDGRVRVLDFGLAKLIGKGETDELAATATAGPISEAGTIVGTVAYMSPEQTEGRPVDARSDVFAFGVVLYEMLTGRHPFRRESRISTMAAILNEEARPLSEEAAGLPPELDRVVQRCLRKDPQRRWQSMADLKSVLEDLKEESESGRLRPAAALAAGGSHRALWTVGALAAVIVLAVALFLWTRARAPGTSAGPQLTPLTFDAGFSSSASVSRDGKIVAYASDRSGEGPLDIWVRHVDRPQPVRRTRDTAGADSPSVSPDGSRIAYRSGRDGGGLYIIDTLGGEERRLVPEGWRPRFSPDGKWILYTRRVAGDEAENKTFIVSPDGGESRRLHAGFAATPMPNGVGPVWSPDGRHVIFSGTRQSDQVSGWWVAPADGGAPVPVDTSALPAASPVHFPTAWPWEDTLIYADGVTIEGINLYRVRMTPGTWRLTGASERLTSGPGLRYDASVASDGRLVFSILTWLSNLWSVPLDAGTGVAAGAPREVTRDAQTKVQASVTADGSRAAICAVARTGALQTELRLRDVASGRETIISSGAGLWKWPRLSPDGGRLAYREATSDGVAAFVWSISGDSRRVCARCVVLGFLPDPDEVLVLDESSRVVRQRLSTGSQVVLLAAQPDAIVDARLSHDGRWIAFVRRAPGGRSGIYIAPVRETSVTEDEWSPIVESDTVWSAEPCWSLDGRLLYYLSERDGCVCVWARRFDPGSRRPTGKDFAVLHAHTAQHWFYGPRWSWSLNATRDRLFMLMVETTANVWTARLPR